MKIKEKIRSSLFLKIILIFLGAHTTIGLIGLTTHRYFKVFQHRESLIKNMEHHSKYIAEDIISKNDSSYARSLADSLNIKMRINSPQLQWQSEPALTEFKLAADQGLQIKTDFIKSETTIELVNDHGQFLFIYDTGINRDIDMQMWRILFPIITMMMILTILYFVIRFLLRPIRDLDRAARKLGQGQLDLNLKTKRRDELGDLVNSFNFMTGRIKDMLKARDQLLLDASHELRSPLTRVKVALEFLDDSSSKQNIREDIIEMETMISELLESERLDSPYGGLHIQQTDLIALVQQIANENKSVQPGLEVSIPHKNLYLPGDPERLKMAIANIIQNALKYSDPNGKSVKIHIDEKEHEIFLHITDFGRGVPLEDQQFIFEPFYRVDKSRAKETGGYGLGLSLTKKIIEAHQGSIEIQSALNEGSTFILKLKKTK